MMVSGLLTYDLPAETNMLTAFKSSSPARPRSAHAATSSVPRKDRKYNFPPGLRVNHRVSSMVGRTPPEGGTWIPDPC